MQELKPHKNLATRDPVHQWITYSSSEGRVIDHPLMQRLRFVKQLTSVELVFPGGVHTRFIHSLGVMHLCGMYMTRLMDSLSLPGQKQLLTFMNSTWPGMSFNECRTRMIALSRLAGLLHDVGHGPFSHSFDHAVYGGFESTRQGLDVHQDHDVHRLRLVQDPDLAARIWECGVDPWHLIQAWTARAEDLDKRHMFLIKCVVGGPLGADRMDFTLRDSQFTGTEHFGTINPDRIIHSASIDFYSDMSREMAYIPVLVYRAKIVNDIIRALEGRRYMYEEIYLHRTAVAGSVLLELMLEAATADLNLQERVLDVAEFALMTDGVLIGEVLALGKSHPAYEYARRYLHRDLPHMISEEKVNESVVKVSSESGSKVVKYTSRFITGFDVSKFIAYDIWFLKSDHKLVSAPLLLKEVGYVPPTKPYCIKREYRL